MEDTLWERKEVVSELLKVLILVLMEDTLWELISVTQTKLQLVLILVLMEDTLWAMYARKMQLPTTES